MLDIKLFNHLRSLRSQQVTVQLAVTICKLPTLSILGIRRKFSEGLKVNIQGLINNLDQVKEFWRLHSRYPVYCEVYQQLHHYCSDICEIKRSKCGTRAEAMEAYKKKLEEYNNSIAAATDDNQQPHKDLVEEEEEHTTNNTIAGAKEAKTKKNESKRVKDR
ncbi:hypothetical protein LWI28_019807 [Acer negundo]|uniref:Uncharacterized protein n=1 Tax=Acer negundo TaxID=4023 RepID=A0AAD5J5X5_ACENE|nr:hypothetical protein LWI28_019807 [Acer negundo]